MERQFMNQREPVARSTVATYSTYAEAQRAVDFLSDQKFPVERTAIVAEGLKIVEQVTGRLNYGRALANGAGSGIVTGIFVSLLIGLFTAATPLLTLLLWGVVVGGVVGALTSLLGYALTGGRRDFTSVGGMQAERYLVTVDSEVAGDATRLLQTMR